MKPYFHTELGMLYLGDCLQVMRELPEHSVDLMVTDPPYEIECCGAGIAGKVKNFQRIHDAGLDRFHPEPFLAAQLKLMRNAHAYIFTAKTTLPTYLRWIESMKLHWQLLICEKQNPPPLKNNAYLKDKELVLFVRSPSRCYFNNDLPFDVYRSVKRYNVGNGGYAHPTVKPLRIIREFVQISSLVGELIIDPYMGSGTTAVACEQLGRRWIGVEINEGFAEIAAKRIEYEAAQGKLWK